MENLSLLEELNGQIIEVTEISMVEDVDKEETKIYEDFKVEETCREIILRDLSNDNNIIHIKKDKFNLFEIEEDKEAGCIEIVCLNRIIRVNTI